jgi:hypothetical protein
VPGAGLTLPDPGVYDGSGRTEMAAYFPTLGVFGYRPANGGTDVFEKFGVPNQTIPFALSSATDAGSSGTHPSFRAVSVSVEIPLTPEVLDLFERSPPRKAIKRAVATCLTLPIAKRPNDDPLIEEG